MRASGFSSFSNCKMFSVHAHEIMSVHTNSSANIGSNREVISSTSIGFSFDPRDVGDKGDASRRRFV